MMETFLVRLWKPDEDGAESDVHGVLVWPARASREPFRSGAELVRLLRAALHAEVDEREAHEAARRKAEMKLAPPKDEQAICLVDDRGLYWIR